jgi:SAM-dependent methyltransferase
MAINSLQVAWISRLAQKKIIRPQDSIVDFGPQELLAKRQAVDVYARRHCDEATVTQKLNELYDEEKPRRIVPATFYSLFGVGRYRSTDLFDPQADWIRDCNQPFRLPERFNVVTNFGTAEHVFNIAAMLHSIHDVLLPGGVALHVLPAFGDIDHGFFNIHPTLYFDLAAANDYAIEDFCYVDRWDIRNKVFEEDISADFDFDELPMRMEHMRDRSLFQRMVVEQFVKNYNRPDTIKYGQAYASACYDYCLVALRKTSGQAFKLPVQGLYGGGVAPSSVSSKQFLNFLRVRFMPAKSRGKAILNRWVPTTIKSALVSLLRRR